MTASFTFTDKESYLKYRAIWKQRYAALSQLIRDLKLCRKSYETIASRGETERYERTKKAHSTAFGFDPAGLVAFKYRPMATVMLEELAAAKQEAQLLYLQNKAKLIGKEQVTSS